MSSNLFQRGPQLDMDLIQLFMNLCGQYAKGATSSSLQLIDIPKQEKLSYFSTKHLSFQGKFFVKSAKS